MLSAIPAIASITRWDTAAVGRVVFPGITLWTSIFLTGLVIIATRPGTAKAGTGMPLYGRGVLATAILWSAYSAFQVADVLGSAASAGDALCSAAEADDFNGVKKLLDQGVDVNEICKRSGETPLEVAAAHGRAAMVELLIEHGAHAQMRARFGETALHLASDSVVIAVLLKNGADVAATDEFGGTPLHGLSTKEPETVKALLSAGAKVNARNKAGETSLLQLLKTQVNCDSGYGIQHVFPIVVAVLNGGPDLSIADSEGNTALSLARKTQANCKDTPSEEEKKAAAQLVAALEHRVTKGR